MNLIDLEILIPASPEFIWRFLGDLQQIPRWQQDAEAVTFLSTQREGRGARWRQAMHRGPDRVVEVSAWYDTVGYMYQIVDGAAFNANQGHIKLREVPEGTLVRWTFQYELGGVFGGLRKAVGLNGGMSSQIQASLRNLHQLVGQQSGGISTHEAKATMQDAPDVGERSNYEPRHPSAFHEAARDETSALPYSENGQDETYAIAYDLPPIPALEDGDTQPNPVALESRSLVEPSPVLDDTKPIEVALPIADAPAPTPAQEAAPPAPQPLPRPDVDIATMSVFEIFGLQKPSQAALPQDRAPAPATDSISRAGNHLGPPPGDDKAPAKRDDLPAAAPARALTGSRRANRRRAMRGHSRD